jgi:2,3-bisphosphoglycerate-independent phosphoglycerate mutase
MTAASRVILVFLDGVGLGPADDPHNPLATGRYPHLARLAGGQPWTAASEHVLRDDLVFTHLDANLGVAGLPQSGTGQATLFTGVNCARLAGRHWGPFPHSTSKPVIARENVFVRLREAGRHGAFANAFPSRFFRMVAARDRWTVTTRCCLDAGVPLFDENDLREGRALPADLTGATWLERLGIEVPTTTPRQAGARLATIARKTDLTLFEYFLTDKAGHARDASRAAAVLTDLDQFFEGLLDSIDASRELLVVTSDHGNLEDLASRGHTRNVVPLIAWGAGAAAFSASRDLTDVTPALLAALAASA